MDQVARRARLSRALVYVYFHDKADLHFALVERSLETLRGAKRELPGVITKSSIMLGLGETLDQVHQALRDLRAHDVEMVTIGHDGMPERSLVTDDLPGGIQDVGYAGPRGLLGLADDDDEPSSFWGMDDND